MKINKEIQYSLQLISNGVSIQVELGLNIVEICANQHYKSQKVSYVKVSMSLYSCYLTIEYIGHVFTSESLGNSRKSLNQGGGGGGGLRISNFQQGHQRNSIWNFQGLIKIEVAFPRVKNNVEFPGVFVFGLRISKGSNTILWKFQG